jgi:hypothetical protein
MKELRPFAWVIIALNAYFFISFVISYDTEASDTANGLGVMFLVFWLAIMNTFLYVLYRITGGKKRDCPACGIGVKKGLTVCHSCSYDFMKAASGEPQEESKKVVQSEKKSQLSKYDALPEFARLALILLSTAILLYGGSWLIAPHFQGADEFHCGLNKILSLPCDYRYGK